MSKEDRMIELLEELVKWTRISGIPHVKRLLEETLEDPNHRLVYHLSDGKSTREIQSLTGVDFRTVASLWKKWYKVGLVDPMPARGRGQRYHRSFSLEDFDIKVPELQKKKRRPEKNKPKEKKEHDRT